MPTELSVTKDLSLGLLVLAGLAWLGLLFAVALWGEKAKARPRRAWPVVYALSLAVYCTAWTFYGVTTQAVRSGWAVPPTFIGTIVLFVLFTPFLVRLVRLAKQHNTTSIADFIASRFGKSSALAAVVTAVAVLGMVPYIALQLKAVAMSFGAVAGLPDRADGPATWQDLAFYVAIFMALFAVLFGTRRAAATEHNRGLVLAMGFESLFKLVAMLALGAFVVFGLYAGPADLQARTPSLEFREPASFVTLALLGALAMFTLPHQFHIGVVECRDERHLATARWLFPLFLLLIALPVLPLARAGVALLGEAGVAPDLYVLMLPLAHEQSGLALFAFLGGLSAATGMVILASLTLSIMLGNHWITPLLLQRRWSPGRELAVPVRVQRRVGIVLVLLLAYAYGRLAGTAEALADIGALSFSGLAQLAPAVVLAVYRPNLPARAILAGLLAGVAVWAYVLLLPLVVAFDGRVALPVWLSPDGLFGLGGIDALPRAVAASLLANGLAIVLTALGSARRGGVPSGDPEGSPLPDAVLHRLAERFLPPDRRSAVLGSSDALERERALEHELAAVVGAASARLLLDAARRRAPAPLDTVAELVGQAAEQAQFSQAVLSGALENMSQGVCVVDAELRLVAWNRPYLDLFDYPPSLIRVGRPVADLLRHNAVRGLVEAADVEAAVQRRLDHKRAGSPHRIERSWPDGRIIEIRGNPMPGGGFVATFSDVTAFRRAEQELKRSNETLEQRVAARTVELEQAKIEAERASAAKSRFLAAVSHDLVQPLNAAQLMTHSLAARIETPAAQRSLKQISGALGATEDLLEALLDISRLDAGGLEPRVTRFALDELFEQLSGEFAMLAEARGLQLRWRRSGAWVETDPQLLRRILQNFLSNAVRYTRKGGILLAARRRGHRVLAGVWDTGPGIPDAARSVVFEEFRRLDPEDAAPGLGLGLAIAERMARLLDHRLLLDSRERHGTLFGVELPVVEVDASRSADGIQGVARTATTDDEPARVLVVDNEPAMLDSLAALLGDWGLAVVARSDEAAALAALEVDGSFDLLLLDYHLDGGRTGLELLRSLRAAGCHAPAVLVSADHAAELRGAARAAGCALLHKPIRPLALKSVLRHLRAAATAAGPTPAPGGDSPRASSADPLP
ncbi:response regulator [Wenzhouxiangella sp. XN79A]|uniref:sensor histidine kinase n=1 Tax=Wenzhouxiangella sp. XN79A TaxID=2724193 RepID=UPI00144A9BDF|nr:PAS-domain containing protein [Wenzhouxiangella sp. XN79A]NKI34975.1 response regulator [Wenzhouxiangella sp. XN79A]